MYHPLLDQGIDPDDVPEPEITEDTVTEAYEVGCLTGAKKFYDEWVLRYVTVAKEAGDPIAIAKDIAIELGVLDGRKYDIPG